MPFALTAEVGLRIRRRPVVRRLRRRVDHELESRPRAPRTAARRRRRRGCRGRASGSVGIGLEQPRASAARSRRSGPKNAPACRSRCRRRRSPPRRSAATASDPIRPPEPVTTTAGMTSVLNRGPPDARARSSAIQAQCPRASRAARFAAASQCRRRARRNPRCRCGTSPGRLARRSDATGCR